HLRRLSGFLQGAQQLAVDRLIAGGHVAGQVRGLVAVEIGDVTSCLAYQDRARRHVPRRYVALPIAVDTSRRDPRQVESGGAETAQACHLVLTGGDCSEPER